ncbi:DUF4297 domain-containing protein [Mycoplasmatota bacterium]|nr:DUF4297 domain-containing protein [Mycoplasmatota bacterium]
MVFINGTISKRIIERKCLDESGINALNGFSFQFSNAIYEIVERYKGCKNFSIVFESHDDFLIIDTKALFLFQAKNFKDKTFTAQNITSAKEKSILAKMNQARDNIKDIIEENVISYLIINNENSKIGFRVKPKKNEKAYNTEEYIDKVCLSVISDDCKEKVLDILNNEKELETFFIKRQLRYSKHSDDVRLFIEDVLNDKFTEPKVNLSSIYDFLERQIKNSMLEKKYYSFTDMDSDMRNIVSFQVDEFDAFSELIYLLVDYDTGEKNIIRNRYKEYVTKLAGSRINDVFNDFQYVKSVVNRDDLLEDNLRQVQREKLLSFYDGEEIVSLILLAYGEKKNDE